MATTKQKTKGPEAKKVSAKDAGIAHCRGQEQMLIKNGSSPAYARNYARGIAEQLGLKPDDVGSAPKDPMDPRDD